MPLYFGLGAATQADSVTVKWPTGKEQVVRAGEEVRWLLYLLLPNHAAMTNTTLLIQKKSSAIRRKYPLYIMPIM